MDYKQNSRRNFMKQIIGSGVIASSPLNMFLLQMMNQMISTGVAHAAGEADVFSDYKFINFFMFGGVPRWYWDLPLQPNGLGDPFTQNKMGITGFVNGVPKYLSTERPVGKFYLPYIWDSDIPTPSGSVPMRDLAEHFMTIRGVNLQIDSHFIDAVKQLSPIPGVSLIGTIADNAATPVPAAGNAGAIGFISNKGRNFTNISGNSPLSDALNPFIVPANKQLLSQRSQTIEAGIDRVLNAMKGSSSEYHKYLPVTFEDRLNAKNLMKKKFDGLQDQYVSLVVKYESLISRAMTETEFNNQPFLNNLDLKGSKIPEFSLNGEYYAGLDISRAVAPGVSSLAASMSIAEYMVKNGYSSCINNTIGESAINLAPTGVNSVRSTGYDPHGVGSYISLFANSARFKAMAACFQELITQLKSVPVKNGTLFDRTIMTLTSDFNRNGRADGSGSDHGWQGSNYTVFSGMITEPTVLGNIKSDSSDQYKGTWGTAAGVDGNLGRDTIMGNVISTICTMMDIPSITPNDSSFVMKSSGGKITAKANFAPRNKDE